MPTLILNADDDPVCSPANTDECTPSLLRDGIRRAVLLRFPAGGHCVFAEGLRARRWADALAAGFIAQVAGRGGS